MTPFERLWVTPALDLGVDDAVGFVEHAFATNALTESMMVEFKRQRSGSNVADAVGAFANTDGGVIFVGVDAELSFPDCVVGITQGQMDGLIDHLQQLMRDAMPEVIALRLPMADRFLVVLRVRADEMRQPVVVEGRVMVRFPGRSIGARREEIQRLVLRSTSGSPAEPIPGFSVADPSRVPLWPEGQIPDFVARIFVDGQLPTSVLEHLWLSSGSRAACVAALEDGPIPDRVLDAPFRHTSSTVQWELETPRSMSFGVASEWTPSSEGLFNISKGGSARVNLHGTSLSVCFGVGLRCEGSSAFDKLTLEDLYATLSGACVASFRALAAVASSLSSVPMTDRHASAWLQPANGSPLTVGCGRLGGGTVRINDPGTWLRRQTLKLGSVDEIDGVVRTWLNLMLLDCGASDFELTIDHLERPPWADESST